MVTTTSSTIARTRAKKAKLAEINRYHVTQFARFLDRLKSVKQREGTLLEHCLIQYGGAQQRRASAGEPAHPPRRPGRRRDCGRPAPARGGDKTPMTNLYRSMLDTVGAITEKVGDSTDKLGAVFQHADRPGRTRPAVWMSQSSSARSLELLELPEVPHASGAGPQYPEGRRRAGRVAFGSSCTRSRAIPADHRPATSRPRREPTACTRPNCVAP